MTERGRNLVVGLTTLVGMAGLATMLLLFGYASAFTQPTYPISIFMPATGGVTEDSRVLLNGVQVGRVTQIRLLEPVTKGVQLTVQVREGQNIPTDARVGIYGSLLGGSPVLTLDVTHLQGKEDVAYLPSDGTGSLTGKGAGSMGDQIAAQMREAMQGPIDRFGVVAEDFHRLSEQWEAVGKNIRALTEQRSAADVDAGKAEGNLATVMARADQRMAELKNVLDGVDKWVNDAQLKQDVKQAAANAKDVTGKLNEKMDELTRRYMAVADDLSGAIISLQKGLDQARAGQGTMGKLINDPSLYNNLNDTVKRLDKAMLEFQLLIQKWKAEGLPIQF